MSRNVPNFSYPDLGYLGVKLNFESSSWWKDINLDASSKVGKVISLLEGMAGSIVEEGKAGAEGAEGAEGKATQWEKDADD